MAGAHTACRQSVVICTRSQTRLLSTRSKSWQIPIQQIKARRWYAQPADINIPPRSNLQPPPPPPRPVPSVEDSHEPEATEQADGGFDEFLSETAQSFHKDATSVSLLVSQYHERAGKVLDLVIPYEERPKQERRADTSHLPTSDEIPMIGDGIVMVVHALRKPNGKLDKICACSGFVVNAQSTKETTNQSDVIITCAHTLEEMNRHLRKPEHQTSTPSSFSYIITSTGEPRLITQVLSSMPKSDLIALELAKRPGPKLRSLPVSPFPVYSGSAVLTHLFAAPDPPTVTRSVSRLPKAVKEMRDKEAEGAETPVAWLRDRAWRRWGSGMMLGYRSYTGIEVEAGIHSSLPHILTSILPTPGSSGGPLVCAESGAVVGMISGRRMDNRVEGERGWGASAEGIFEMFSLPGFTPAIRDG